MQRNVLVAYLNINSIRNKLTALKEVISDCIDILIIAETKLDKSFPTSQLDITGYIPPLTVDRNQHGGGILIYIKEGIPAREISLLESTSKDIEAKALEINLHRIKWLLFGIYHPPSQTDNFFLNEISKNIEHLSTKYENFLVIGDFNLTEKSMVLQDFMQRLNFKNVIKELTFFKSNCPTCIDLILTSDTGKVSNTRTIEIGLSDFHVMVTTSLKGSFQKKKPKIITYRDYKKFGNQIFNLKVREAIDSVTNIQTDFSLFNSTVKYILNKQAPLKQKYIRANDAPFMSKYLMKAIMKRSRLKNRFTKTSTDENWLACKTQRNLCVKILRENKKSYYAKIDTKAVGDNKRFWTVVKPLFSNKVQTSSCITLLENNIVNSDEKEVADILNDYFTNITQTLGTSQESKGSPVKYQKQSSCEGIIEHFQSHPSILKIKASVPCTHMFSFKRATVAEMKSQLQLLNIR